MTSLIPREPFNITTLRQQMDDLFDHFFPFSTSMEAVAPNHGISVDVIDKGKAYRLKANIPGVSAKDLDVRVLEDSVVINGTYQEEKEEKQEQYVVKERRSGSFTRTVPFREPLQAEMAEAKFKDGVLELMLPKQDVEKRQGRQLKIQD
ncbi:Hsp20/alpha crystallin family protein [Dethiobacter alkaliphilus]|uniref:Hsp20/alpha crystallin family protein n=1 Tax=Dethiobacter alkaliphilus TaxID=427926 RepID=UPI002226DFEA|nr:Hsp20/alpha crystallin family protein [Dethiobacter alkaliphilus]MCW3490527.1 Hsp20/alpha crystallin family protein [Dethiobacter alkaliphilus]